MAAVLPELEEIKRVLWEEWDPIGVNASPEAADEYDMYAVPIYVQLHQGASVEGVTDYLEWVVTDRMGLQGNREASRAVAERIVAAHADQTGR